MQERRLAAIMFTDIVGYTALMGSDEDRMFEVLRKNRKIHSKLIKQFNGTLIKEMGDGMLISFNLASDAVRCAIVIQKACKKQNIPLKIGIHEGEMVFEENDVLGDGVNIASRLQDDTREGCITISDAVYQDIKNKHGIIAEFVGEKSLKNVDEPIKVYQVYCEGKVKKVKSFLDQKLGNSIPGLPYYILAVLVVVICTFLIWPLISTKETGQTLTNQEVSIAVLPFDNISGDPSQDIMCDGLTEEIRYHLSIIKDINKVISKNSSIAVSKTGKTTPEIAETLGVNHILEGSYRESGDSLRITTKLIEASTDDHLWSRIYPRAKGDIFEIQSDIAQNVALELKRILTPEEHEKISKNPTNNLEAYYLYQEGRYFFNKHTKAGFLKSIGFYNRSIELDFAFAQAYIGIAEVYQYLVRYHQVSRSEFNSKAKEAIIKALEIDPLLGEAHSALGLIMIVFDWNFKDADQEFQRAIELSPGNFEVYSQYAISEVDWQL